jgi:hypothetical protein
VRDQSGLKRAHAGSNWREAYTAVTRTAAYWSDPLISTLAFSSTGQAYGRALRHSGSPLYDPAGMMRTHDRDMGIDKCAHARAPRYGFSAVLPACEP